MKIIIIILCLFLFSCSKTEKAKAIDLPDIAMPETVELAHIEEKETNEVQIIDVVERISLPKMELTRESFLAEFPESPDYFIDNNIDVSIVKYDALALGPPLYFGAWPVYVDGENFSIIYATDEGYEIRLVELKGKTIFSYWNQYFDATWDDVKRSWGEPNTKTGSRGYIDNTDWGMVLVFPRLMK
jgi:hypothetical protein